MKIAVVGCGAMGSVYAALFASVGHEVWAIDTARDHVAAMLRDGLRLEGASGDRTVRVQAATDSTAAGPCDLVILATKAMHVAAAATTIPPLLGPATPVLSIQNGLGGPEAAAEVLGRERIVVGVVGGFGASMIGPGHAHHNGWELVRLGEFDGVVTPRVEAIASLWEGAGFRVKCFDDVGQLVWEKLVCNVAYSGPCALLDVTIGELLADPDARACSAACATEAHAVARALGIRLDIEDAVSHAREFGERIPGARPSTLLDLRAGRCSEIDTINGAIPRAAARAGLQAPVNAAVTALVRAKERARGLRV
ncbi:MAG: 2-dehydropantoate 2-reductase [Gammaproteobacteria bacterium]|nr:2-dehydropantoate 2-reductase [Gammaproteobacteria bacterium]